MTALVDATAGIILLTTPEIRNSNKLRSCGALAIGTYSNRMSGLYGLHITKLHRLETNCSNVGLTTEYVCMTKCVSLCLTTVCVVMIVYTVVYNLCIVKGLDPSH